jgi:predicted metal-dependent peptidase
MTNKKASSFDLELHIYKLLDQEPFFSALSRRINKSKTTAIPTAGVRINPNSGRFEMFYNPEFFESLTPKQRLGVLKHEFYHLIFNHVSGRVPPEGLTKAWNIATDLAINSFLIGELPENGCFPTVEPFQDYPVEMSAEWYLAKLKSDPKFNTDPEKGDDGDDDGDGDGDGEGGQGNGGGGGQLPDSLDDHGGWGDVDQSTKEMAEQRLKETLKDVANEMNSSGGNWGSVSSKTRKEIQDFITAKVDWRKVLRYFIKTSQRAEKRSTVKRLNSRYPYIHAGKKVTRRAKIAISIDQSGSVSDSMLALFFTELNSLSRFATFDIIPFDTEVAEDQVYTWKKGKKMVWERVAQGGTCFKAPTKWVNTRGYDAHLIMTDLCAPKPQASKCQRAWITTPEHAENPYFATRERLIVVE